MSGFYGLRNGDEIWLMLCGVHVMFYKLLTMLRHSNVKDKNTSDTPKITVQLLPISLMWILLGHPSKAASFWDTHDRTLVSHWKGMCHYWNLSGWWRATAPFNKDRPLADVDTNRRQDNLYAPSSYFSLIRFNLYLKRGKRAW